MAPPANFCFALSFLIDFFEPVGNSLVKVQRVCQLKSPESTEQRAPIPQACMHKSVGVRARACISTGVCVFACL